MSRWLAHAEVVEAELQSLPDNMTKGDKRADLALQRGFCPLLSYCQVGDEEKQTDILCSIERGNRRPGAIATDTTLGATVTYQLLDRLKKMGRVSQEKSGVLNVIDNKR